MAYFLKKALLFVAMFTAFACAQAPSPYVTVQNGQFVRDGKPYTYVGTNFWYGPILASDGRGGNLQRLTKELDTLKAIGITNLRVLVGGDGPDGVFSRVDPSLQTAPGVYNDTLLVGLDRFLAELGKRDMQAVLFLNNSWEWSGGYGQYLEWATGEKTLIPLVDGYWPFMQQMAGFQVCKEAQTLYCNHVRAIVGRTNTVTGKPYSQDPAIFSWQLGNEPRCFSDDPQWITVTVPFANFLFGADGSLATGSLSASDFSSLTIFVWSGGVAGTECHPVIKIDNIRAVPNK